MDLWEDDDWYLGPTNFYVFFEQGLSCSAFSNHNDDWPSYSLDEENLALTSKASYLKIITQKEMILIIL